jgi:SOS-response transcriptional repressor LexA
MLDISQGGVGHYLNGRNALNAAVAAVFARALQVDVSDFSPSLAKEISAMSAAATSNAKYVGQYAPGIKYPVLSKIQAGHCRKRASRMHLKISIYGSNQTLTSRGCVLVVGRGESMTAPVGLSIPEGTYVLFDTGREPVNGSLVIAKLSESNEATFKKLIIDGDQKYLKGLNPQWPLVPINGNCRIIGVAVETKLRLV